ERAGARTGGQGLAGDRPRERDAGGRARAGSGLAPAAGRERYRPARTGAAASDCGSARPDRRGWLRACLRERTDHAPGRHPRGRPRRRPGRGGGASLSRRTTGEAGAMSARPQHRADLKFVEQVYRGEESFIVKDPVTHKYFRFRPVEALVLQSFDGRPIGEIALALAEEGFRLSAGAIEGFARKLATMGLMERSLAERTTLEMERLRAERSRRRRRPLFRGELLRMRWSGGDPDSFLNRTIPSLRWCFTPGFVAASIALFALYFLILAATWTEFGAA